ncbi:hypothetical protein QCA50_004700 [Cerrena zonata]|uniref:F-box domain-containing protein n=1 Tax=Cerrena zonata TaxID=2478898 RepID=A0AAW0GP78_9APHY
MSDEIHSMIIGLKNLNLYTDEGSSTNVNLVDGASDRDTIIQHQPSLIPSLRDDNMHLPISKLPPEIVCVILRYISQDPRYTAYQWIHITHIYHYWRMIALSDTRLWSTIYLCHPNLMDEVLERVKDTHLHVIIDCSQECSRHSILTMPKPHLPTWTALAMSKITRIWNKASHLTIHWDKSCVVRELLQCLGPSKVTFPDLTTLSVEGDCSHIFSPNAVCVSTLLSIVTFSSLQSLRLPHLPAPCKDLAFPPISLTRLEVAPVTGHRGDVKGALVILAKLPNLQFLSLRLTKDDSESIIPQAAITLPYLRELHINAHTKTAHILLESITRPIDTALFLNVYDGCRRDISESQGSKAMCDTLMLLFASTPSFKSISLRTEITNSDMYTVSPSVSNPEHAVVRSIAYQSHRALDVFHKILNRTPLASLQHLRWDVCLRLGPEGYRQEYYPPKTVEFYTSFNNLEHLTNLDIYSADTVAVIENHIWTSGTPLVFPQLQKLCFFKKYWLSSWYSRTTNLTQALKELARSIRAQMLLVPSLQVVAFYGIDFCQENEHEILTDALCDQRSLSHTNVRVSQLNQAIEIDIPLADDQHLILAD